MKVIGYPNELAQALFNLDKDKKYQLTEYKEIRGLQANKYFHLLINELARYNRGNGFAISDDQMKVDINLQYGTLAKFEDGRVQGAKVPKGTNMSEFYPYAKKYKEEDGYECYMFYKRTSELNTQEFCQLIQGLEKECQEVGIKTLSDMEFEKMMEEYERG